MLGSALSSKPSSCRSVSKQFGAHSDFRVMLIHEYLCPLGQLWR